ncbi:hypothetical protein ES703_67527 [subsurface metagenome]
MGLLNQTTLTTNCILWGGRPSRTYAPLSLERYLDKQLKNFYLRETADETEHSMVPGNLPREKLSLDRLRFNANLPASEKSRYHLQAFETNWKKHDDWPGKGLPPTTY